MNKNWMQFEMLLVFAIILNLPASISSITIKGPPTAERNDLREIVRVGEDVKLVCPMSGNPTLMFEWSKNHESITDYSWTRFRTSKNYLKISKATVEDSGIYLCKGTNGFGSETVPIHLIVIDPKDFPNLREGELPNVSPPEWTSSTNRHLLDTYRLSYGDHFRLICEARGKPQPKISWYFRNREIISRSGELNIESIVPSDAGSYSCVAKNLVGTVTRNVTLTVDGSERKTDNLSDLIGRSGLENMTVEEGSPAALECKVKSPVEPNIKWLKRLETWEYSRYTDVIEVENKKFRFIKNPDSVSIPIKEGIFVNKLIIPQTTVSDSGMYYCFIALRVDYEFKNTYLTVLPKSTSSTLSGLGSGDPILIVVVCLAVFVFLLLVSIILCVLIKKRNKESPTSSPESPEIRENLMQNNNHHRGNKLDQPLPAPPPAPHYYESSGSSSRMYDDRRQGYYPPPPSSVASQQNQYEVPHAHGNPRTSVRYLYGPYGTSNSAGRIRYNEPYQYYEE